MLPRHGSPYDMNCKMIKQAELACPVISMILPTRRDHPASLTSQLDASFGCLLALLQLSVLFPFSSSDLAAHSKLDTFEQA